MTDDERKRKLDEFRNPAKNSQDNAEENEPDTYWTNERMIAVANKILERLGRDERL